MSSLRYDRKTDRFIGHSHPGSLSRRFVDFEIDEMEVGARAALALGDPEQWWWEIHREQVIREISG